MPPKAAEKTTSSAADAKADSKSEAKSPDSKVTAAQQRSLEAAIVDITKAYGDGSIMRLGAAQALRQIEVIPTGALAIGFAVGGGGRPTGGRGEDFWAGIIGQDDVDVARDCQCAEGGRPGGV